MQRTLTPELLDDPSLDKAAHQHAHAGLRRINAWSRTAAYLRQELAQIAHQQGLAELRVLDVACGSGVISRDLGRKPLAGGVRLVVDGCDISPEAIRQAQDLASTSGRATGDYYVLDALSAPIPRRYDVVLCTLFLHHLDESQAVGLLRNMESAADHAVLVDDLVRSRLGYATAWVGCRLLSRSYVVHHDGPVSVRGAYTPGEAVKLAALAGMRGATFRRHWPHRYLLNWGRG